MNPKLARIALSALIVSAFNAAAADQARADLIVSNFAFGSGTPFGGMTTLGGADVTLVTTNTEPFGASSFRDTLNTDPATVTFTFSRSISEFVLDVSFVHPEEYLTGFNIGDPTSLTGTLINLGGFITTSGTDDTGFGRFIWTGINATSVSFTIGNFPNPTELPALAVDQFGFDAVVPEPSSLVMLGSAFACLMTPLLRLRKTHHE